MTLESCNHYIALADGPWFYAPVLLLEVKTDDPSLWTATGRLPTTVRYQGLTYPLAHSVEIFFVHMVHAAELRYVAPKCGTCNPEGAWSPGVELPAELSWAALVSRSRELAGDGSFVWQSGAATSPARLSRRLLSATCRVQGFFAFACAMAMQQGSSNEAIHPTYFFPSDRRSAWWDFQHCGTGVAVARLRFRSSRSVDH